MEPEQKWLRSVTKCHKHASELSAMLEGFNQNISKSWDLSNKHYV